MSEPRYLERIRGFDLFERLSPAELDALLARSGTILSYEPGEVIYSQGQADNFVSYLLEGRVERTRNGIFERVIDYDKERRTRPLDPVAQKGHTLRAASRVTLLRLTRRELERAHLDSAPAHASGALEVTEIAADTTQDWRTLLLGSELFSQLAAQNIQNIFECMVEVSADKGQEVIRQGEPAGAYYVIQSGACEVLRDVAGEEELVHLADLGPGEGFGEEAAIYGTPRDATVRMLSDGRLMRIDGSDFLDLMVKPLVRGVGYREAAYFASDGSVLVDAREPQDYEAGSIEGAMNVPMHLIRKRARTLDGSPSYIVCHDVPGHARLGAFHFIERGLDACFLDEPIGARIPHEHVAPDAQPEVTSMNDSKDGNGSRPPTPKPHVSVTRKPATSSQESERVPREDFTDTITGKELADIIDELYRQRKEIEESDTFSLLTAPSTEDESLIERLADADGANAAAGEPEALVKEIIRDIDLRLNQYIKHCIASHQEALTRKFEDYVSQIEEVAQEKVAEHDRQIREHYEAQFTAREQKLREDYERLTGLANKLAQQKAEIQNTRKKLAEMLQTANRVNQAVYRAGNALVAQVGHLGQINGDGDANGG
jgi:CRP-like cAMP-binding protein/rhodanese-related sulfurtransferase